MRIDQSRSTYIEISKEEDPLKLLIHSLIDKTIGLSIAESRHFDLYMEESELDLFWKELEKYNQLFVPNEPQEKGLELKYPLKMYSINGITITLNQFPKEMLAYNTTETGY